jgi:hypothetical protein
MFPVRAIETRPSRLYECLAIVIQETVFALRRALDHAPGVAGTVADGYDPDIVTRTTKI